MHYQETLYIREKTGEVKVIEVFPIKKEKEKNEVRVYEYLTRSAPNGQIDEWDQSLNLQC